MELSAVGIEATWASVEKWLKICQMKNDDIFYFGSTTCPLCDIYLDNEKCPCIRKDGEICPVSEITGSSQCVDSPWENLNSGVSKLGVRQSSNTGRYHSSYMKEALRPLVIKEYEFLVDIAISLEYR